VTLVFQIGGALLLGALLGLLMFGGPGRQTVTGLTVLALGVTGFAFWGQVWSTGRMFIAQAGTYPSIHEANIAPGSLFPADENLLDSAEAVIPRGARVLLLTTGHAVGDSPEWIGYQLSPRLLVERIQEAQYVLVYGASPRTVHSLAHLPIVLNRLDGGVVRTGGS
jgi:hypothetical protein